MRTAKFDKQDVLRAAILVFVEKGFSQTSMQDLTKATGLHPGSIYAAFENKRGLLLSSLNQYVNDKKEDLENLFPGKDSYLAELKAYLDGVVSQCASHNTDQHCLLIKSLNELASQDTEVQHIIKTSLENWQLFLENILSSAQSAGELNPNKDCAQLARFLVMGIYGLRIYAQTQPEEKVLSELAENLYAQICR